MLTKIQKSLFFNCNLNFLTNCLYPINFMAVACKELLFFFYFLILPVVVKTHYPRTLLVNDLSSEINENKLPHVPRVMS